MCKLHIKLKEKQESEKEKEVEDLKSDNEKAIDSECKIDME